jgi:hypothetical protein
MRRIVVEAPSASHGGRTIMRKTITSVMFVVSFTGILFLALGIASPGGGAGIVPGAQAQGRCSNDTVRGTYGGFVTGSAIAGTQQVALAVLGTATFDGRGIVAGGTTESINGAIEQGDTFAGSYTVNANCTGSMTFIGQHPAGRTDVHHFDMVVVDGGKEIAIISTDPTTVLTGWLKRQ